MADRTSAEIFGRIFEYLANDSTEPAYNEAAREFAEELMSMAQGYDFNEYQMGADDALLKLGVAGKCECGHIGYLHGRDGDYHEEDCSNMGKVWSGEWQNDE